jgi:hypothetical protein
MNPDIETIIEHSIEYAQDLIEGTLEFYPFGAFVDTAGIVHPLEFEFDAKKMPQVQEVLEGLEKYCENQMALGKMHAYGLIYESELILEADADAVNCISIVCKHKEETDIPLFYQSYTISEENDVSYSDIFGVKR